MPRPPVICVSLAGLDPKLAEHLRAAADAAGKDGLPFSSALELHQRAEALRAAAAGAGLPVSGLVPRQIRFGRAVLHAPSMAAAGLVQEAEGWGMDEHWYHRFWAYCLAHSYDPDGLGAAATKDLALRAVHEWSLKHLAHRDCTEDVLQATIEALVNGTPLQTSAAGAADPGQKKRGR